jgi:hypothetical protein
LEVLGERPVDVLECAGAECSEASLRIAGRVNEPMAHRRSASGKRRWHRRVRYFPYFG